VTGFDIRPERIAELAWSVDSTLEVCVPTLQRFDKREHVLYDKNIFLSDESDLRL